VGGTELELRVEVLVGGLTKEIGCKWEERAGKGGWYLGRRTSNGEAWLNCGVVVRQSRLPRSTRESNCRKDLCSRLSFSISAEILSSDGHVIFEHGLDAYVMAVQICLRDQDV
jgi:hypothetical protein